MNKLATYTLSGSLVALALGGCTTMPDDVQVLQRELKETQNQNTQLQTDLQGLEADLAARDASLSEYEQQLRMTEEQSGAPNLPPKAKAGECYARVFIPPQYENRTKKVLQKEASEDVEIIPAQYEWVTQQVMVREPSKKLQIVPARYEWVEEQVMVKEASSELLTEPAVYENVVEQLLVKPAYTTWKKGRGPIEKIDHATGEIMCLVEVPAEYKTVTKRKLVKKATAREVAIPAQYNTVKKRVMVEPAKTVEVEIPAEYETVRVKKLVKSAEERRIMIPAEYQQVTEQFLVADGALQWRSILCETNTTPDVVTSLQHALNNAGYSPGRLDGVLGPQTMRAVNDYQKANGLPSGELTMETLRSLKVAGPY